MDTYGLHPKFKLNRPLDERELAGKLDQNTRIELEGNQLIPDLKVIEINSNYLEMVDKFYSAKGYMSFLASFGTFTFLGCSVWFVLCAIFPSYFIRIDIDFVLIMTLLFSAMGIFMLKLLKTEWFAWTHYPLRFDRKNQLVHVHRTDGSVFSVPWNKIFFTTGLNHNKGTTNDYYISGHVLAKDNITVKDTFCLPASCNNLEELKSHWEFIRRYMEEGPEKLIQQVGFCLPIANKKESYSFTFFYLMTLYKGAPYIIIPFLVPLAFIFSIPRYIGILTSRRPIWPESIQKLCYIDKDDPYVLDEYKNPKNLWRDFL